MDKALNIYLPEFLETYTITDIHLNVKVISGVCFTGRNYFTYRKTLRKRNI
jgi:hypothetical protein